MRIAVASDHAGFEEPKPWYKPEIVAHIVASGHEALDLGPEGPGSVDYPDFADRVAEAILSGAADMGVLLCGTGMGISMAANRHRGIRAALCCNPEMAVLAREHNDANVLCVGRRTQTLDEIRALIDIFLQTPFNNGERHRRRVDKMG